MKQYGNYKEEENISFRALFLPDPQGRILAAEKCDFHVGCPQAAGGRHVELEMKLEEERVEELVESNR